MVGEIKEFLSNLKNERSEFREVKSGILSRIRFLEGSLLDIHKKYVDNLLPNLEKETIHNIQKEFPTFHVPMEKVCFLCFTLSMKPSVSLEELKNNLLLHLDENDLWQSNEISKDLKLARSTLDLTEKALESLNLKIRGLEKLILIDREKLSIEMKNKLENASKACFLNRDNIQIISRNDISQYRRYDNSGDTNFLEMWLWYQLLFDDSELSVETNSSSYIRSGGLDIDEVESIIPSNSTNSITDLAIGTTLGVTTAIVTEEILSNDSSVRESIANNPTVNFSDTKDEDRNHQVVSNCDCKPSDCSRDCDCKPSDCSRDCDCRPSDCTHDCSSNCNCDCHGSD